MQENNLTVEQVLDLIQKQGRLKRIDMNDDGHGVYWRTYAAQSGVTFNMIYTQPHPTRPLQSTNRAFSIANASGDLIAVGNLTSDQWQQIIDAIRNAGGESL